MEGKNNWISCFDGNNALNIVVEVGFVTGVTPAITPTGSAISIIPSYSFSLIIPTVLSYLIL